MEHLGHPLALYDLPLEEQVEAVAWWFACRDREAPPAPESKGTGDPALDAFNREMGKG
jgi:hypothetical protein